MEPVIRRCEFCETSLATDLEVSQHLISNSHRDKVDQFNLKQPQNPRTVRNPFKSILDVYTALRLRTARDVSELSDLNYFRIPDGDQELAQVAKELSTVLLNCFVLFITKNLRPDVRKGFLEVVGIKEDPQEPSNLAEQRMQPECQNRRPSSPTLELPRRQSDSPPLDPVPTRRAPVVQALPAQDPVPELPTPQPRANQKVTTARTEPLPATTSTPERTKRPTRDEVRSDLNPQGSGGPSNRSTEERVGSNSRSNNGRPRQHQESRNNLRDKAQAEPPRGQPIRNNGPRHPPVASTSSARPTSSNPQMARNNPFDIPPHLMPMSGASVHLARRQDSNDAPRPCPNSTYKPLLAQVKVEPRDK